MPLPALQSLQLRVDGGTAWLSFHHGKANEMGRAELAEIAALAAWLGEQRGVHTLVTSSERTSKSGTPIFVSGANVTERRGWDDAQIKAHVRFQRQTLAALRDAPVLHIGVVAGVAFGWGTEYLLTCDYVLAVDGARFALPETGLGILPGAGGTAELQRRIGPAQALRLGLTGEVIDAAEAVRIGLAQERFATQADALARATALATAAGTRSPTANAAFKAALLATRGLGPDAAAEIEAQAYEHCVDSGEAAIGRARFGGDNPDLSWGERRPLRSR